MLRNTEMLSRAPKEKAITTEGEQLHFKASSLAYLPIPSPIQNKDAESSQG